MGYGFRIMWYIVTFIFNSIGNLFASLTFQLNLRTIRKNNERLRNVETIAQPQPISALMTGVCAGKSIVSGDDAEVHSSWRNAVTAQIVRDAADSGRGVLILHNGNRDLIAGLEGVYGRRVRNITRENPRFDLTSNLSVAETVRFFGDYEASERYNLGESSLAYLEVLLAMCRQATRRVPLFSTLVRIAGWRREELLHQLEVWIESEKMTPEEASAHQTALNEYRDGQRRLNNYLHTISTELGDLLAGGSVPPRDRVTIGSALQRGEVLALDVSGVHDRKCIFGILTMLLEDAIDKVGAGYLVLDGVSFMECERLSRLVTAESPRMGLHISASDISARCGNDADKLNAVLTGSRCSIILRHSNGRSCTCLSNGMGTYEHTEPEMIMHMGSHKSAKELLGGNDRSRGFNLKKEIRPRVQPGDIQTQNDGVAYVVSADNRQITLCPLSDN